MASIFHSPPPRSLWKLALGATPAGEGTEFRVWAPAASRVEVVLDPSEKAYPLTKQDDGFYSSFISGVTAGARYRYRLDGQKSFPDPCSRFQPEGPHGPSLVIDPETFRWNDAKWPGLTLQGQVLYEMHIGTFTSEGTFDSAALQLAELKKFGITAVEVMPVNEWAGRWNWGYDGVDLFAPTHRYGDAQAFKRFVDRAHDLGLGVVLDVVYNHLGPDGCYLREFSPDYFTDRYKNDWGAALNFDGPGSAAVRNFFIQNACYWVYEFHVDGLRLDATQHIYDTGPVHVLGEISRRAREAAGNRSIILIGENEPQDVRCLARVEDGGYGLDALWNDDFHHAARVALTGFREAYYKDYLGTPQEFISLVKRGFLYQGQFYAWQKQPRGTVLTDQPARSLVIYLQDHDQVANHVPGLRIHELTPEGKYRAVTTLMLLAPQTPMFFMGQEFGASSPFDFFADHHAELSPLVHKGRKAFLKQFRSFAQPAVLKTVPDPAHPSTFEHSKLNFSERRSHSKIYRFHQALLKLRRDDLVFSAQDRARLEGAVLGAQTFLLRYFGPDHDERLVVVHLGKAFKYGPTPEPLLAPPFHKDWLLIFSSEDASYGGPGKVDPREGGAWRFRSPGAWVYKTKERAPKHG